jgi:succinate dehydrogenase/fumarate reductase flavoprotein subunit
MTFATCDNGGDVADGFDVLVIGAGIAGTTAALAAAERGASVALASAGTTFSGSSFFPGTWGLGLVGPDGPVDEDDLVRTICEAGRGMASPTLARLLVEGIGPAVDALERRGVTLMRAAHADEPDFIPCFDHKHRSWHGLGRKSYREATRADLERAGVTLLPHHDLLDLVECDGVRGAVLYERERRQALTIDAGAVVLATGGFGGLFERTLTTPDVTGTAQAVALMHGASLVNVEFVQIMAGMLSPVPDVVFNERTFRFARVEGFGADDAATLLASRAAHGPFTASLPDRAVDLAIAAAGTVGARVTYRLPDLLPEFMRTYFDWFWRTYGANPTEGVRITPYAHASNGGILVDTCASCGVPGLYACGEVTGGMHGADRLGGLSSANGLVFGGIAGRSAAAWAAEHPSSGSPTDAAIRPLASPLASGVMHDLRHVMSDRCLVVRTEKGLAAAAATITALGEKVERSSAPCDDWQAIAATMRARQALLSAAALVTAMRARTESRGAHYRADFPDENPALALPVAISWDGDSVRATRFAWDAVS